MSVVIPTLNEVRLLPAAIASAMDPHAEILVADGGSTDATVALAERLGARVVRAGRGRGIQLAAGAEAASGELLLFLHADAVLPRDYLQHVQRAMADRSCVLGAFRLRIAAPGWGLRIVEWGAGLRSRLLALPYGDQAFFLRASEYRALGGFADLPAMEDLELVRRARRRGRVRTLRAEVAVSPRAWQRHGVLRVTIWNAACAAALLAGVAPDLLARLRTKRAGR